MIINSEAPGPQGIYFPTSFRVAGHRETFDFANAEEFHRHILLCSHPPDWVTAVDAGTTACLRCSMATLWQQREHV